MGSSDKISKNFNGTVHLEYLPCINYAMIHNHVPAFSFCELINNDEIDWNRGKDLHKRRTHQIFRLCF